ncbi:MAG: hypothetical protein AB1806_07210 [Acidobacteriota bacterium]
MERDESLRRVERDAIILCGLMTGVALALQGGRPDGALGVLGGGALMALSYRAIKRGVDVLVRHAGAVSDTRDEAVTGRGSRRRVVWFVLRYALLAAGAYVILIPLRAHPLGVISGVTAPVAAIALEAVRLQWQRRG